MEFFACILIHIFLVILLKKLAIKTQILSLKKVLVWVLVFIVPVFLWESVLGIKKIK